MIRNESFVLINRRVYNVLNVELAIPIKKNKKIISSSSRNNETTKYLTDHNMMCDKHNFLKAENFS